MGNATAFPTAGPPAMKVYLVDDSPERHQRLITIVKHLHELTGSSVEPGFGNDAPSALRRCVDPGELAGIFQNENDAIFIIDLVLLNASHEAADTLIDELTRLAGDEPGAARSLALLEAIDEYQKAKSGGKLRGLSARFPLPVLVMILARRLKFPSFLTSTQAEGEDIETIVIEELAAMSPRPLYKEKREKRHEDDLITIWCTALSKHLKHPLDQLNERTAGWFSDQAPLGAPGHNRDESKVEAHKSCIKGVLPWAPDTWWSDREAAEATHQCLKNGIGDHAAWIARGEDGREFTLASAFLIFQIVLHRRFPEHMGSLLVSVVDWKPFIQPAKDASMLLPFLPPQNPPDARRSVQALYEFFDAIISFDTDPNRLAVTQVTGPSPTRHSFGLKLAWASQVGNLSEAMRTFAETSLDNLRVPAAGKTLGAFLRFIVASQVRRAGLGTIGTISIDGQGWVRISS